ncbi:hypothetical protein [Lysinibacillus sp. K60]|uniref:hypothetical protein n=1 Tax=Lysinibacillus sp. K60 TaxID=2720027 RepID=UPI001C8C4155|nr:hypothetical protein [Lysinibacillus sp. K60]MBX8946001.1 hypothetical protein [Lysinibacillus sp. K60]
MKIPFETHTIYITLDDAKIYELKSDFTKVEVKEMKYPSRENPIMGLHKKQFDFAKGWLLDKNNPFKMDVETAVIYNRIGFISNGEFNDFIKP